MKTKINLSLMIVFILFFSQSVFSQTKTIRGTVSNKSGAPLPGVNIVVIGTNNGSITDFDGHYTVNNVSNSDKLTFSSVGMVSQTIDIGDQIEININLIQSLEALDEVVIVGYGKQSRVNVTGAISTIKSEEIDQLPVTNAESAFQGRSAGLTVTNSGIPGSSPNVFIRGIASLNGNSPLYVIDGIIVGNLSGINPSDIESVSVLKDASTTAVYGAQGSNGVIIVTTKTGTNKKGQLSVNSYTGIQTFTKRYDLLNTVDYLKYASEYSVFPNRPLNIFQNSTDYQDQIFRLGLMNNYSASYSGGGENGSHHFSAGYLNQEGTLINTGFERYSFRVNGSQKFGKLNVGETMAISFSKQSPERQSGGRTVLEHALKAAPYLPVFNASNPGGFQGPNNGVDGQDAENPVRAQTIGEILNKNLGIIGNVFAEYNLTESLKARSQVGLDYFVFNSSLFLPSFNDDDINTETGTHSQAFASISRGSLVGQTLLFTNSLTYTKQINDLHNIEILALMEKFQGQSNGFGGSSRNTITDQINQVGNEQTTLGSQSIFTNKLGFLGRLNYNYDSKYLLSASLRRDATSRFGLNRRWGNFSSISLGWNIANENFMENSNFSTLKLRPSYGTVGSDGIGDYEYATNLTGGFEYPVGGDVVFGVTPDGGANPDLQWESKAILNLGLDIGILKEKITATFEYYNNRSDKLLIEIPAPLSNGINAGNIAVNVGSAETKGFEVILGYNDLEGQFTWSANINLATTKNEVLSLGTLDAFRAAEFTQKNFSAISNSVVGQPLFSFFGLESDGIYRDQDEVDAVFTADPSQNAVQPGDVRYRDLNGDGTISAEDRTFIGNPYPDFTYGINFNAGYKNLDLNVFISGVQGNDIFNTITYDLEGGASRLFNVSQEYYDNKWSISNPEGTKPRIQGSPQNNAVSDRFVEDGSFTRLKNMTLGYTLGPKNSFKKYFSKFRMYISGQNLLTLTKYSGLDPEIGQGNAFFGIDAGFYPQPKSLLFGIDVSF